jgi:hypothetical protein
MTEPDWFSVVEGGELEQGDLLRDCPVPVVHAMARFAEGGEVDMDIQIHDLCVLTQSCDLANAKVDTVLLGRVVSWSDLVEAKKATDPGFGGQKMRVKVRQGLLPDVCLLHRRKSAPKLAWSVVDFHHLYVLPRAAVVAHAASLGPRLRLESPYREHLAQALARFFMRVGLPHDARTFDGDPGPP